jgi:hypothetical protein
MEVFEGFLQVGEIDTVPMQNNNIKLTHIIRFQLNHETDTNDAVTIARIKEIDHPFRASYSSRRSDSVALTLEWVHVFLPQFCSKGSVNVRLRFNFWSWKNINYEIAKNKRRLYLLVETQNNSCIALDNKSLKLGELFETPEHRHRL